MIVYPAIDLLDGACVRLRQGDYAQVTKFSGDPLEVARSFRDQGASALHVVDLDGAKRGTPVHARLIREIARESGLPVQVGGGIRTADDATRYLEAGVHRVLIGTAAADEAGWLDAAVARFGDERIAAAVDVRDGRPVVHGWLAESEIGLDDLTDSLRERGIRCLLYTDTRRDGMLSSVDTAGTRSLVEKGFRVIAAGGVGSVEDIRALRNVGAAGAVVGSALYRRRFTLAEALEAAC